MILGQRILVTGAGGFIGRRLAVTLAARGAEVTGWTRGLGDLSDSAVVGCTLADLRPAVIFHLAAGPAAPLHDDWRFAAAEVQMLTNLADAMPVGATLIHCGSCAEYGRSGTLAETDHCRPGSQYGFAKASVADRALALVVSRGLDIRVARLFNVYGPGEAPRRLVPHLVLHLLAGQQVPLGDADQVRDFVHVDDVCDRLIGLATLPRAPFPVINIGTGVGVTIRHVAQRVADQLGANRELLKFGALPRRSIDQDVIVADVGRLPALGVVPAQHWLNDKGPAQDFVQFVVNDVTAAMDAGRPSA